MLVVAVLLGASLVGVGASPGSAADTTVSLGLDRYHDMVVDQAHGHLFFSQGPGRDGLLVTDLDGALVATITGQPGASGMVLHPDGTRLYVGLADGSAISEINTETLTEVARHPTGEGTCPMDLGATTTHIWYGFRCVGGGPNRGVGSLDLRTSPPTNSKYPVEFPAESVLSVAGDRMALGARRQIPADVYTYDISSGEPIELAHSGGLGSDMQDLQVTPDGSQVVAAFGSDNFHSVWRTQDLSADGVYPSGADARAVSISPDNSLVAVGWYAPFGEDAPDVRVYRRNDGQPLRTWDFGTGYGMKLAERGLAFSPDGSRLYAITTDSTLTSDVAVDPQLHILENPGLFRSALTIDAPPTGEFGQEITLSGQLAFVSGETGTGVQNLVVRRENRDGVANIEGVTTQADGAFSFTDTLRYGVTRYTVSYPGDRWHEPASRTAEVRVAGRPGDLDLDGDADLVVGAIGEDIGARWDVGSVVVLRGAATGVSGAGAREFTQNTPGVPGTAESGDQFGSASTQGDFNGDEFPDVAVSAPGEDVSGMRDAGAVTVLPGTAAGPAAGQAYELTSLLIHQFGDNDEFGRSLATGDFNGDGFDDLAVGAPGTNALMVFPGSVSGLDKTAGVMWDQGILPGEVGNFPDEFGRTLATGDVDADGFDDLAVGAPQDNEDRGYASGSVTMVYGSDQGLTEVGAQLWSRDSPGVQDQPRPFNWNRGDLPDDFGAQISLADYDGDGYADLAVGAPGAPRWVDGARRADAGSVSVLYGAAEGITDRDQLLAEGRLGIPGVPGDNDRFGVTLTTGDVHGDGIADLAVTTADERAVILLTGAPEGLGLAGTKRYSQATPGVPGADEKRNRFGASLRLAPLDGDRFDDLAIGVPGRNVGRGAAVVLYARGRPGLTTKGAGSISQASPGVPGTPERNDWFGYMDHPPGS